MFEARLAGDALLVLAAFSESQILDETTTFFGDDVGYIGLICSMYLNVALTTMSI